MWRTAVFIPNDGITEIIAHFIGHFHVHAEDIRFRHDLVPSSHSTSRIPVADTPDARPVNFRESLDIDEYQPQVSYTPLPFNVVALPFDYSVSFVHVPLYIPAGKVPEKAAQLPEEPASSAPASWQPQVEEPGSTILIASQVKYLMDDDVIVVGDYKFTSELRTDVHAELESLAAQALSISEDLARAGEIRSVQDSLDLVAATQELAKTLSEDDFDGFDNVLVESGETLDGYFSNGSRVDKQPTFAEFFAAAEEEKPDDETKTTDKAFIDASKTPTTMNVSSGGNASWNEASIISAGLAPSVISVAGDYHRVDAIFQTNVLRDLDTVDETWPAQNLSMGGNTLQNSAGFLNHDYATKSGAADPVGGFPQDWAVTTVEGDMIFLDWVQQYNFTSDNDTQILTATGTYSNISSGLNLGVQALTFANIGLYYDLIIIGGSLYDGNIINQTNVLLDSDHLSSMGKHGATRGDAATGGNVLWNEALIENIGPTGQMGDMPDHYEAAVRNFASGDTRMPSGFSSDSALDGLGNLKVLYISGNVFDIRYISQTNVLGDADSLAIYEASLLKAQDSIWKVSTGQNTLFNKAKIQDYDGLGKSAYVGGQIYSDALLVQADMLDGLAERVTPRGNDLANEALAFLVDQTDLSGRFDDHIGIKAMIDHGVSTDTFQSMFA
jgi:hypothetical protein